MDKIVFPLRKGMNGSAVGDLQQALHLCLLRGLIVADDEATRQQLSSALAHDRGSRVYGDATGTLVELFRKEQGFPGHTVDRRTANALNSYLRAFGVLPAATGNGYDASTLDTRYTLRCQVRDARGQPIAGLRIETWDQDPRSPHDLLGVPAVSDADGTVTFHFSRLDFSEHPGERGPDLYFKVFRSDTLLEHTLPTIGNDRGVIRAFEQQQEPIVLCVRKHHVVLGVIVQANGLPLGHLMLQANHVGYGGTSQALGDPVKTDATGRYSLSYDPGSGAINLELRMVETDKSVPLMKPRFGAGPLEVLNLVAPVKPVVANEEAEYPCLKAQLQPHVGTARPLADARESIDRQDCDLTALHIATGWDARLIGLAALSERLIGQPELREAGIQEEEIYGLLRMGLPLDPYQLARMQPDAVERALKLSRDAGIVSVKDGQIASIKNRFALFVDNMSLRLPAPGSSSSYGELLDASGVDFDVATPAAQHKLDQRKLFAAVLRLHGNEPNLLWETAAKPIGEGGAGLAPSQIAKLKWHGKLAYLTGNSAPMTKGLLDLGVSEPQKLIEAGFHRAEPWKAAAMVKVGDNKEALGRLIPGCYIGSSPEARLEHYAQDMARKVRMSYPNQVLAHLIKTETAYASLASADSLPVLKRAVAQGFKLGHTPVASFLKVHNGVLDGLTEEQSRSAKQDIEKLYRLYQITPRHEAMPVLGHMGVAAAYDVTQYTGEKFQATYNEAHMKVYGELPPEDEAGAIHRKAAQVSWAAFHVAITAKQFESSVPLYALSPSPSTKQAIKTELARNYATIETLFGSQDYCECEHCRSVLSPAAYLVDLLQLIERWGGPAYETLVARRPDIPNIPLSCENTNTLLPYIDVANEILEYFVAHGKLEEEAAHDTAGASSAELLAEPQYVMGPAYDRLCQSHFPIQLPFDLGVETARQLCDRFQAPLDRLLEVFSSADLKSGSIHNPVNIGTASLEIPNEEAQTLTEGFACTCLRTSAGIEAGERNVVASIGQPDSGEAGFTTVTFVQSWVEPPQVGDSLAPDPLSQRLPGFIESLGLSPEEFAIFTETDPLRKNWWHGLYGLPSDEVSISNPTNADNATADVPDAMAGLFREGLDWTHTGVVETESKTLLSKRPSEAGAPGMTTLEFRGKWDQPPSTGDRLACDGVVTLQSAKALSRRLGVSYKDLTEIILTRFVNPDVSELTVLYKLGVNVQQAKTFKINSEALKDLYKRCQALLNQDASHWTDAEKKLAQSVNKDTWTMLLEFHALKLKIKALASSSRMSDTDIENALCRVGSSKSLVLRDPEARGDFDLTTLEQADGKRAPPIAFLRINLFVRLWRKLGWTIDEVDEALQVFVPADSPYDEQHFAERPLRTVLIYLAHLKSLDEELRMGRESRFKLLSFWSDIPAFGKRSLYAQLLLTRSVLKSEPLFDHPLGKYLQYFDRTAVQFKPFHWHPDQAEAPDVGNVALKPRLLALQAALGLTADEVSLILNHAGASLDAAEMSLANVSRLYRHGQLARALKLTVADLLALKELSGIDPFEPLHTGPLTSLRDDCPYTSTIAFVRMAAQLQNSGLTVEDLDYLFRHRFDPSGKYRQDRQSLLVLLKTLSEGIRSIRIQHGLPDDLWTLSDEWLSQKLSLLMPPKTVTTFTAMLHGNAEFTAIQSSVDQCGILASNTFILESAISAVTHDDASGEQKLGYRGVLFESDKAALLARFIPVLTSTQQVVFAALLDAVQDQAEREVTALFTATKAGVAADDALPVTLFNGAPRVVAMEYDKDTRVQTLKYQGVLSDKARSSLLARCEATLQPRQNQILAELLDGIQLNASLTVDRVFIATRPVAPSGAEFDELPPSGFADSRCITEVRYVPQDHAQVLSCRGVLSDKDVSLVVAKYGPMLTERQQKTLEVLLDAVRQQARDFFDRNLLRTGKNQPIHGFLDAQDYAKLFPPARCAPNRPQEQDHDVSAPHTSSPEQQDHQRRVRVAQAFLPFLQGRLTRQFVVQTLAANENADAVLVDTLLTDATKGNTSLLDRFAATIERGTDGAFYGSDDLSGIPLQQSRDTFTSADTALRETQDVNGQPLEPLRSARFDCFIEVPEAGAYRFCIEMDAAGACAELCFAHLPEPVFLEGKAQTGRAELEKSLELRPGIPYQLSLQLRQLDGGNARLLVEGESLAKGPISRLTLYPASVIDEAVGATTRLLKSLQLVQNLGLNEREVRYIAAQAKYFGGVRFHDLPAESADDSSAGRSGTTLRFNAFLRLAAYTRLKRELAIVNDELINVFEASQSGDFNKTCKLLAGLTRREVSVVQRTAACLFGRPSFDSEKPLHRLWDALQMIERFGVQPEWLQHWTLSASMRSSPQQRRELVDGLKKALKARFEPETWQRWMQPISNRLRARQRDALLAFIMEQRGFDRAEQVYEDLLIDPGMEPVVQTSRIRLAISSVQLFIQRCFLNLESEVRPSAGSAEEWKWMKRYRVWEANRKIFLFPENWLEPEFRDDKTHLFQELESKLLQGDVSNDLVEDAFFSYIQQLDELARLDIVALYTESDSVGAPVSHVFGRTYSQPRQYFYRRYSDAAWTPWEPVRAKIEGDHLAPVIWRDRLYLFWVTFMEKPYGSVPLNDRSPRAAPVQEDTDDAGAGADSVEPPELDADNLNGQIANIEFKNVLALTGAKPISTQDKKPASGYKADLSAPLIGPARLLPLKTVEVQLHWSEYLHGEWSDDVAGDLSAVISRTVLSSTTPRSVFIHVTRDNDDPEKAGGRDGIYVHLGSPISSAFYLAGRNSKPEEATYAEPPATAYDGQKPQGYELEKGATRYNGHGSLQVRMGEGSGALAATVLDNAGAFSLLPDAGSPAVGGHQKRGQLLFFQDNRYSFFAHPTVTEPTVEMWEKYVPPDPPDPPPGKPDVGDEPELDFTKVENPLEKLKWRVNPEDIAVESWHTLDQKSQLQRLKVVLNYGGMLIGQNGWAGLVFNENKDSASSIHTQNDGSGAGAKCYVELADRAIFEKTGLAIEGDRVYVVGPSGIGSLATLKVVKLTNSGKISRE